jgi:hypothetical protein
MTLFQMKCPISKPTQAQLKKGFIALSAGVVLGTAAAYLYKYYKKRCDKSLEDKSPKADKSLEEDKKVEDVKQPVETPAETPAETNDQKSSV